MATFPDHFSAGSDRYAAFRPTYPTTLYEWLGTLVPPDVYVWDCGTGSGQAAAGLRRQFARVIATDPSESQLRQAPALDGVQYAAALAESSPLAAGSIGLITVAQALHWFDLPRFEREVRRVAREGGVLAVWSYGLFSVDPAIDELVQRFNDEIVGPYWPPERALVDRGYSDIEMSFEPIASPPIHMTALWTLDQLAGYIRTWSAVSRYKTVRGVDPTTDFVGGLTARWGRVGLQRVVSWPLAIRVWKIG